MAYTSMEGAIILKGTRHGLLASVREDADWREVLRELSGVASLNADYLKDAQLVLDFGWRELNEEQFDSIIAVIKSQGLGCNGILSTSLNTRTIAESRGYRAIIGRLGLAQHQGRRLRRDQEAAANAAIPAATAPVPVVNSSSGSMAPTPAHPVAEGLPVEEQQATGPAGAEAPLSPTKSLPTAVEPVDAAPATVSQAAETSNPTALSPVGPVNATPEPHIANVPNVSLAQAQLASAELSAELNDPSIASGLVIAPRPVVEAKTPVEDSLEMPAVDEASIETAPSSTFDSSDPVVANLPAIFDSSELEGSRVFTSSQEPGIHVPHYQDEEPTLYIRKTLRSGQRVVFAGNVVVIGDLNPGAQIEADGDVIVLGQLRGSVHAGCEGDEEATVITSSMRATQLRIADRFYTADTGNRFFKKTPPTGTLRARLDGDTVVVEALPVR